MAREASGARALAGVSLSQIDAGTGSLDDLGVYGRDALRFRDRRGAPARLTYGEPVTATPTTLLADALRVDPARPLLTFHDHRTGERSELSVATFANWVAKTANLVSSELDPDPGAVLSLELPAHWQATVWLQAAWAAGLVVDLDGAADAAVRVVAHERADAVAGEVVSLGLGPLGLPQPGAAPATPGALDYDREVHSHGDRFDGPPPAAGAAALVAGGATSTARELAVAAAAAGHPGGALLVTEPPRSVLDVLGGLLVPLATGVTAVICRHADPDRLAATVAQERVVAAVGRTVGHVPAWRATQRE